MADAPSAIVTPTEDEFTRSVTPGFSTGPAMLAASLGGQTSQSRGGYLAALEASERPGLQSSE